MSTVQQGLLFGMDGQERPVKGRPFSGTVIYETSGRAREYRELACNLYTGCDHRCVYCYAPQVLNTDRSRFGSEVKPRANIIAKLERDARRYGAQGEDRQVLFCFTCDPYQQADIERGLTGQAILACHRSGLNVAVLTKAGRRALRDIDLFTAGDSFASTLTLLDAKQSQEWEPGAALPDDRLQTLQEFHDRGIPTWVSLEPVLDPAVTLQIIRLSYRFVDEFKVGILNYHARAREINWRRFAYDVWNLLEELGCRYYLKHDLRRYLQ